MARAHIDDVDLNYESIRVDNPIHDDVFLVFLHEALGSIQQWKSFPNELCQKLNLNGIVYERQGHGESSPLSKKRDSSYLHEYALIELPQFLDAILPIQGKVILVGHSDGGSIALLYASRFPHKVHSVVTLAAHVINEPETITGIQPALEAFESGKLDKLSFYHGNKTSALFYSWAYTWTSPEFQFWNICDDIKDLNVPILALQGENDQYGTSKQLNLIKQSTSECCETLLIPNCGHHPHLEQAQATISIIFNWFSGE